MRNDDKSYRKGNRTNSKFDGESKGMTSGRDFKGENRTNYQPNHAPQRQIIRKQVDPETTKYFSEIANLFESNGVDLDERGVICANALEETRGKEFQLATDYIISHTLEMLLEGCDIENLCYFLRSCAEDFPSIAMDRSGSHVAESAIRSLARRVEDSEVYALIEDTLTRICKVIGENPVDMMHDCYGSHVLRSVLSLCKGLPLDSPKSVGAKSSKVLAERLNFKPDNSEENTSLQGHRGFPDLLKILVSGIFDCGRADVNALQIDQYSSLVLQRALKVLAGDDDELLKKIPIVLGCRKKEAITGDSLESNKAKNVVHLVKETAFSHLMEVILEVAPEALYGEMLEKVFKGSMFELSSHHCGNFVVQALVSHARNSSHMDLIWKELGPKFKDLFEMGKPGVIASVIAASQRLHTHEEKCCEALVAALSSGNEAPKCIVPRILFLDSYVQSGDKANWNWQKGVRMHVIGSLILQEVFRYPSALIQPFVTSIVSMETDNVVETAKDSAGSRVIEAFIGSDVSVKVKRRLIGKLRGHFGELGMHMCGSFTVEKCFGVSNVSLQETIVSELSELRSELTKTKQGTHLIRKLDVYGFSSHPEQWKSKLATKQSAYTEFQAAFGSKETVTPKETEPPKKASFLTQMPKKNQTRPEGDLKNLRKEIDDSLASPLPFLSTSGHNKHRTSHHRASVHDRSSVGKKSTTNKNRDNEEKTWTKKRPGEDNIQFKKGSKKFRA